MGHRTTVSRVREVIIFVSPSFHSPFSPNFGIFACRKVGLAEKAELPR